MPFIVTADYKPALVGSARWQASLEPVKQMELFVPDPAVFSSQL